MEILVPNAAIRNLIREDKIHQIYSTMQTGQEKYGMQTFNQSLASLYFAKQITLQTALGISSLPDELQDMINRGAGLRHTRRPDGRRGPIGRRAVSGVREEASRCLLTSGRARPATARPCRASGSPTARKP